MADLTFPELQQKMQLEKKKKSNTVKYAFRNAEDIYTAFKELKSGWSVIVTDKIIELAGKIFIEATAVAFNDERNEKFQSTAYAEMSSVPILNTQKGQIKQMQEPQWTGAVSSYARKYALQGLFAIGEKDVDDLDNENNLDQNPATNEQQIKYIDNDQYNQILNGIRQMAGIFGRDENELINQVANNFRIDNFHQVPAEHFGTVMNWIQDHIAQHQGKDDFNNL